MILVKNKNLRKLIVNLMKIAETNFMHEKQKITKRIKYNKHV